MSTRTDAIKAAISATAQYDAESRRVSSRKKSEGKDAAEVAPSPTPTLAEVTPVTEDAGELRKRAVLEYVRYSRGGVVVSLGVSRQTPKGVSHPQVLMAMCVTDRDEPEREQQANAQLAAAAPELAEALANLVDVINAAGLINLSRGVQLGPTVWHVKATDAMEYAGKVLAKAGAK